MRNIVSYKEQVFYLLYLFFVFLGPHLQQMEVPRLGIESELQLLAYTTATETWDLSQPLTCTAAHGKAGFLTH